MKAIIYLKFLMILIYLLLMSCEGCVTGPDPFALG